jgi:hypothetical protein
MLGEELIDGRPVGDSGFAAEGRSPQCGGRARETNTG